MNVFRKGMLNLRTLLEKINPFRILYLKIASLLRINICPQYKPLGHAIHLQTKTTAFPPDIVWALK